MNTVVSCHEITKTYQQGSIDIKALSNVSIDIEKAEFVCLSGPSGSGKTTLLNMIGGLDTPSAGEITVDGQRIDQMSKADLAKIRLHKIGFVFQAYNLIPVLSAKENVEMVLQMQGVDANRRGEMSMSILNEVGLEGMEHRRPSELSGGQQQRVAVARAIVSRPSLILADEPTANLDSQTAEHLLDLMRKMNDEHQSTFIISTHDPMIMERSKKLVKLHDGQIIDTVQQV